MKKTNIIYATLVLTSIFLAACSGTNKTGEDQIKSETYNPGKANIDTLLNRFDSLDFDVYSNQEWNHLHASHADDILVHYPDGHTTKGLPDHIEELKPQFIFAPDTKIKVHPVRFGSEDYTPRTGDWTSVIGIMEGTFTKPMPTGNRKTIAPTGKHFKLQMVTVGHWKNGKMDEEYLFYDNKAFMKQIGLEN